MKKEKKKKRLKRELKPESVPEAVEITETAELQAEPVIDSLESLLNVIGGKWKIRILWALRSGASLRYVEIKHKIPSITDMMLSQSLRDLASSGLIDRQQYQQIPPKVEYRITPTGMGLIPGVELLNAWASKNLKGA